MTHFEVIILTIIYLVCYGYTLAMFIEEKNVRIRILLAIVSLALAFWTPLIFGEMLYNKLKEK